MIRISLGPAEPVIEEIRAAAERHRDGTARIMVAWARDEGAGWLVDALQERMAQTHVLVGLNERGTTVEGLLRLLPAVDTLHVFFKHPRQTFHPKVYWFEHGEEWDASTAIVGSANLTRGGLFTNFETSLVAVVDRATATDDELELIAALRTSWDSLLESPYSHPVTTDEDIRSLYLDGYLSSEATQRRERRRRGRTEQPRAGLPTAPPPPIGAVPFGAIEVPFSVAPPEDVREEEPVQPPGEDHDPAGVPPLPDRFYVRTLTENDVRKLVHGATGTFEPDIGETARDRYPAFWGWPEEYVNVTRTLSREEWAARGRLFSSLRPDGVDVEVMLWFRPVRPGHAAEHRLRIGPIGTVRAATPRAFDTDSLLVLERAPATSSYDFTLRLITPSDPGYDDFAAYLTHQNPQHRYGYGPD